jgi:hypothetical protein
MNLGFDEGLTISLNEGVNNVLVPTVMFEFQEGIFGPQAYFEFGIDIGDGKTITKKQWLNLPSKKMSDGSEDQYYDKKMQSFNVTLSQYVTGFYSPSEKEVIAKKINECGIKANEEGSNPTEVLKVYLRELKALLPDDWNQKPCQLILHYPEGKEYISIPKSAKMNSGRIFNRHEDRNLTVSAYFSRNFMGQQSASSNDDDVSTDWGA